MIRHGPSALPCAIQRVQLALCCIAGCIGKRAVLCCIGQYSAHALSRARCIAIQQYSQYSNTEAIQQYITIQYTTQYNPPQVTACWGYSQHPKCPSARKQVGLQKSRRNVGTWERPSGGPSRPGRRRISSRPRRRTRTTYSTIGKAGCRHTPPRLVAHHPLGLYRTFSRSGGII